MKTSSLINAVKTSSLLNKTQKIPELNNTAFAVKKKKERERLAIKKWKDIWPWKQFPTGSCCLTTLLVRKKRVSSGFTKFNSDIFLRSVVRRRRTGCPLPSTVSVYQSFGRCSISKAFPGISEYVCVCVCVYVVHIYVSLSLYGCVCVCVCSLITIWAASTGPMRADSSTPPTHWS